MLPQNFQLLVNAWYVFLVAQLGNASTGTVQVTAVEKLFAATPESAGHFSRDRSTNAVCAHTDICTPACRERQN